MSILKVSNPKGEFDRLGEVFMRAVTHRPSADQDDRLDIAQGILCTISKHADDILESSALDQAQILTVAAQVLNRCAKIVEQSDSEALKKLAPEIREQAASFQPVTA